jgi:hypothetical protein
MVGNKLSNLMGIYSSSLPVESEAMTLNWVAAPREIFCISHARLDQDMNLAKSGGV